MGQALGNASSWICGDERLDHQVRQIMQKYEVDMSPEGRIGEGSFAWCHRGRDLRTGKEVAIKVYKCPPIFHDMSRLQQARLKQFQRCVEVLQLLQTPFDKPKDPRLWTPELERVKPDRLFMRLLDYSGCDGVPGPDPTDGRLYVVTEMAQQSLKHWITARKQANAAPSPETVRCMARAIVLVVAGLHAKGLVHMDLKPDNLMVFNGGRLKLIDVDGCAPIGTLIKKTDPLVSFTPVYCAPEWASFLSNVDDEEPICVQPGLDAWSAGCTICELVTLDAILRPVYKAFVFQGEKLKARTAEVQFMRWLCRLREAPMPRKVQEFDDGLAKLVTESLLVCGDASRKTCAETLMEPYFAEDNLRKSMSSPITYAAYEEESDSEPEAEPSIGVFAWKAKST